LIKHVVVKRPDDVVAGVRVWKARVAGSVSWGIEVSRTLEVLY